MQPLCRRGWLNKPRGNALIAWQRGAFAAGLVFLIDRFSKWWIVGGLDLPSRKPVEIFSFFDLSMVWNKGISLGLFPAGDESGRYILIGLTSAVSLAIAYWLYRAQSSFVALALGLVLGGAIGNIWDRFQYGAVADFFHFHLGEWSFYVFNVADAAITLGVLLLIWEALLSPQKKPR